MAFMNTQSSKVVVSTDNVASNNQLQQFQSLFTAFSTNTNGMTLPPAKQQQQGHGSALGTDDKDEGPHDGRTVPHHKSVDSLKHDVDSSSKDTASRQSPNPQQDALQHSLLKVSGANKRRKLASQQLPAAHATEVKHNSSNGNKKTKPSSTVGMGREEKSGEETTYTDGDLDQLDNIGANTKNANIPIPGSSINGRARRNLKAVRYEEDFIVVDDSRDSDEDYDDEPSDASSECEDGHDHISVREEDTPDDTRPINYEEDMLDEDRPTNSDEDMLDEAPGTTNRLGRRTIKRTSSRTLE